MKIKYIAIFLLFISPTIVYSQVIKSAIPKWVTKQDYELNPDVDLEEITEGTLYLLYTEQINIPKEEVYYRSVFKIIDNVGVQNASNVSALYDPSYQSIRFHNVTLHRDGKSINKLDISSFQTIRRETNAENYMYDGSLNVFSNITDVRSGDILDVCFSVRGFNPIHKGNLFSSFSMNNAIPIGKVFINVLTNSNLNYLNINTDLEPKISTKNGLKAYSWTSTNTKSANFENNTPYWKIIYETILISEYDSWKEVVDWGVDIYKTNEKPNKELKQKINEITSSFKTDGERIKATLNFVQNEIRYLALSSGIGAYKPFPPNDIFENRYGDCKDKTLLMIAMLKEMDIKSYPVLVNTGLKETISELPPSHQIFDHCVIKVIDKAENEFWYDPTYSNQGGNYQTTYFPNYKYGLVLKPGNTSLDEIYCFAGNNIETTDEYTLEEVGNSASLKVTTTYYENEADKMRNYYKQNSIIAIKKDNQNYYTKYYKNIRATENPIHEDNLEKNEFLVTEFYQIDSLWTPDLLDENRITTQFTPYSIVEILQLPNANQERKTDFAMYYPASRRHLIKVKLPKKWNLHNESKNINSTGFYYNWNSYYNRKENLLSLEYYLQTQKDLITVSEFDRFLEKITELDNYISYHLISSKSGHTVSKENSSIRFPLLITVFGIVLVLVILIIVLIKRVLK